MVENEFSRLVLDRNVRIHRTLGRGLLESVYEHIPGHELHTLGLYREHQRPIPVQYDGPILELGFRADIIVERKVFLELTSVESIHPVHKKRVLACLKLTGLKLGLSISFNVDLVKHGFFRIVNGLSDD